MSTDPIRDYLKAIGKTPLLTKAEEQAFGEQIQAMIPLLEIPEEFPHARATVYCPARATGPSVR